MSVRQLTPDLHIIPGLVNVYLLETDDGIAVLDTGFPGHPQKILDGVRAIGRSAANIRHIILTHCHPDHVGSAAALKRETGATVWAHPIDAPLIEAGVSGRRPMFASPGLRNRIMVKLLGGEHGKVKQVEPVKVDRLLKEGDAPSFAPDMTTIHLPGHSAGQIGLLWQRHGGVLFPADACLNRRGLKLTVAMEDRELALASLARLATLDFDKICVMHGRPILSGAGEQFRRTSFAV